MEIYDVLYVVAALPILADMSVDVIVSQIMIPLMLMNLYMNLASPYSRIQEACDRLHKYVFND